MGVESSDKRRSRPTTAETTKSSIFRGKRKETKEGSRNRKENSAKMGGRAKERHCKKPRKGR